MDELPILIKYFKSIVNKKEEKLLHDLNELIEIENKHSDNDDIKNIKQIFI